MKDYEHGETAKEGQNPMGEVGSALETLNSCTGAMEELVMKCHTRLLGEFEFPPTSETEAPLDRGGELSSIRTQITTTRRQIQRCIEVMESVDSNIS